MKFSGQHQPPVSSSRAAVGGSEVQGPEVASSENGAEDECKQTESLPKYLCWRSLH